MDEDRLKRHDLSDAEWARLEPLLPRHPRQGHRWNDHGRATDIATSLLTATDGILGTHRWLLHIVAHSRPMLGVSSYERTGHICRLCAGNVLSNP